MTNVKQKYSSDFKADAVRLVFEQGRSVADVARSLDVHVNTLHGWVRGSKDRNGAGAPRRSNEHQEINRLRRELRRVTEERDREGAGEDPADAEAVEDAPPAPGCERAAKKPRWEAQPIAARRRCRWTAPTGRVR